MPASPKRHFDSATTLAEFCFNGCLCSCYRSPGLVFDRQGRDGRRAPGGRVRARPPEPYKLAVIGVDRPDPEASHRAVIVDVAAEAELGRAIALALIAVLISVLIAVLPAIAGPVSER